MKHNLDIKIEIICKGYSKYKLRVTRIEGNIIMFNKLNLKVILLMVLSLMLILTGCGSTKSNKAQEEQKNENVQAETGTRTITDDIGRKVEVPDKPERIVTDWYLGQLLALDVTPVGAVMANLDYAAYLKDYYKEDAIENIGDGEASLEKVMELNPDLIITWDKEAVEKYEKIAPTIVFSDTNYKSIHEEIKAMGEYLGRTDKAEQFLEDFDKRIAVAKEKINKVVSKDSTFTIFDLGKKNLSVIAPNGVVGGRALYETLGMTPPPKVKELFDTKEADGSRYEISYEVVNDYVGDYVIEMNYFNKGGSLPATWTNLDAVKKGAVIKLAPEYYFASDPVSVLHQAEDLATKIEKLTKEKK